LESAKRKRGGGSETIGNHCLLGEKEWGLRKSGWKGYSEKTVPSLSCVEAGLVVRVKECVTKLKDVVGVIPGGGEAISSGGCERAGIPSNGEPKN